MSRSTATVLTVSLLLSVIALGCKNENIVRWCDTYQRGYNYVTAFAFPALDTAAGLGVKPEWVPVYGVLRQSLDMVHVELTGICERFRSGDKIDISEVASLIAQGTDILAQIIRIQQEAQSAMPERDLRAGYPKGLVADLFSVQAEALRYRARK